MTTKSGEERSEPGRPPVNQPKDDQGHHIAASGQRIVDRPGLYGGVWYRDKNTFVQYGRLRQGSRNSSERFVSVSEGTPAASVQSESQVPKDKEISGVQQLFRFYASGAGTVRYLSQQNTDLFSEIAQQRGVSLSPETIATRSPRALTNELFEKTTGLPAESVLDIVSIFEIAKKLNVEPEEVFVKALAQNYTDDDGFVPDNFVEIAEAAWESYVATFEGWTDDPAFTTLQSLIKEGTRATDFELQTRVQDSKQFADMLLESYTSDVPIEFSTKLLFTTLRSNLGLFDTYLTHVGETLDSDGNVVPASEAFQHQGKFKIDPTSLKPLIDYLTRNVGTDDGSFGHALAAAAAVRFHFHSNASHPFDRAMASPRNPDGSFKDHFLVAGSPSLSHDRYKNNPDEFFYGLSDDEKLDPLGVREMLRSYLIAGDAKYQSDDLLSAKMREINQSIEEFIDHVKQYNDKETDTVAYQAFVVASARGARIFDGEHPQAFVNALQSAREYAGDVAKALAARDPSQDVEALLEQIPATIRDAVAAQGQSLWKHQLLAVNFALVKKRCVIALDTGLGKTRIAPIIGEILKSRGDPDAMVINFLPKPLVDQYPAEVREQISEHREIDPLIRGKRDEASLSTDEILASLRMINDGTYKPDHLMVSASLTRGTKMIQALAESQGLLARNEKNQLTRNPKYSVEEFRSRMANIVRTDPIIRELKRLKGTVILDEAHDASLGLRNPNNVGHMIIKEVCADRERVIALTATPVPNTADDVYNILSVVTPGEVSSSLRDFRNLTSKISHVPEYDENGEPTGAHIPYFDHGPDMLRQAKELKHLMYVRHGDDPEVQKDFQEAGINIPAAFMTRVQVPATMIQKVVFSQIARGIPDHALNQRKNAHNDRVIAAYRKRLSVFNPKYEDEDAYPDEALWSLRSVDLADYVSADGEIDPGGGEQTYSVDASVPTILSATSPIKFIADAPVSRFGKPFKPPVRLQPRETFEDIPPEQQGTHKALLVRKAMVDASSIFTQNQVPEFWKAHVSPKLQVAAEIAKSFHNDINNSNKAMVIAATHVSMFDKMYEELLSTGYEPAQVARITGDGDRIIANRNASMDRDALARAMAAGEVKVVLLGSQAGGAGLNLQAAGKMLILEDMYTYYTLRQLVGRVVRPGQKVPTDISILSLNQADDLANAQRVFERSLAAHGLTVQDAEESLGITATDSEYSSMLAAGRLTEKLINDLRSLGIEAIVKGDHIGLDYVQEGDEVAGSRLLESLGFAGAPLDMTQFDEAVSKSHNRLPHQRTTEHQRFVKNGYDQLKKWEQKIEHVKAQGIKYNEPAQVAEAERLQKNAHRAKTFLLAVEAAAAAKETRQLDPSSVSDLDYSAGGFKLETDYNPFQQYAEQEWDEDRELLHLKTGINLIDNPQAAKLDGVKAGPKDVFTNLYLWNAIKHSNANNIPDFVDRVLAPIQRSRGIWGNAERDHTILRLNHLMLKWSAHGLLRWYGDDAPSGSLPHDFDPIFVPAKQDYAHISPEEALMRVVKEASPEELAKLKTDKNYTKAIAAIYPDLDPDMAFVEAKEGTPKFTAIRFFLPSDQGGSPEKYELDSEAAANVWHETILPAIRSGEVKSLTDLAAAMDAEPTDALLRVLGSILKDATQQEFVKRKNYSEQATLRLTPRGKTYFPNFGPVPYENETITPELLSHAFDLLRSHITDGNDLSSPEDFAYILFGATKDEEEKQKEIKYAQFLLSEFAVHRLVEKTRRPKQRTPDES